MLNENDCLKDLKLQKVKFQARSRNIRFVLNRLFEEARQSFLQGCSPAATWVLAAVWVLNTPSALGAELCEIFRTPRNSSKKSLSFRRLAIEKQTFQDVKPFIRFQVKTKLSNLPLIRRGQAMIFARG